MRIQNTIKLSDGQRIHVMGHVQSSIFHSQLNRLTLDDIDRNLDQQSHYAVKKIIKESFPELYHWLIQNNALTTCWIDPKVFKNYTNFLVTFDFGIGFKPEDPMESLFVLSWS